MNAWHAWLRFLEIADHPAWLCSGRGGGSVPWAWRQLPLRCGELSFPGGSALSCSRCR